MLVRRVVRLLGFTPFTPTYDLFSCGINATCAAVNAPEVMTRKSFAGAAITTFDLSSCLCRVPQATVNNHRQARTQVSSRGGGDAAISRLGAIALPATRLLRFPRN